MRNKNKLFLKLGVIFGSISITSMSVTSCSASSLAFDSSIQVVVSNSSSVLADQSFSESAYNGMRDFFDGLRNGNPPRTDISELPKASDSSVKENNGIWKRPGNDTISRVISYRNAFDNGSSIVLAAGFNHQESIDLATSTLSENKLIKNSFHDGNGFLFIDSAMSNEKSDPYNVCSISYKADDGAFLTAITTAVFLNLHQDYFGPKDGYLSVSSFVGLPFGNTLNFMNGFRLGIHYWNKILQPLIPNVDANKTKKTLKIKWLSPTGNTFNVSQFTSGSFSVGEPRVNTIVDGLISQGVDAIFPIAGPQTSMVTSRVNSHKSNTLTIGVDTAQENDVSLQSNLPNNSSNVGNGRSIQFSSIKNVRETTKYALDSITNGENGKDAEDKNKDGYRGFGWNNVGILSNNGVGVSENGLQYLINPNWKTWQSKGITKDNISLETFLKTEGMYAKTNQTTDPVISEYVKILNNEVNTMYTDQTVSNIINSTDGLNGPKKDGYWGIFNDKATNSNDFLTINLSKLLTGIEDATYLVTDVKPSYVGIKEWTQSMQDLYSKDKMFFRKN